MKNIINQTLSLLFTVIIIASCNGNKSKTAYVCPMHCQQDTAYTNAGSCPTCGMDLENSAEIDSLKTVVLTNLK